MCCLTSLRTHNHFGLVEIAFRSDFELAASTPLQLRLVLEMADLGNLKDFLRRGGFTLTDGQRDMAAVVSTALDIARAMLHLHTECIIHSDLKVSDLCRGLGGAVAGQRRCQICEAGHHLNLLLFTPSIRLLGCRRIISLVTSQHIAQSLHGLLYTVA
jgi:serine/threonine protein kinase